MMVERVRNVRPERKMRGFLFLGLGRSEGWTEVEGVGGPGVEVDKGACEEGCEVVVVGGGFWKKD
jgi:hypothetical protein